MNYIERPEYMQRLLDLMGTPDIKMTNDYEGVKIYNLSDWLLSQK